MALRLKKDIKKASYYVWFLGAQESRGLRGEEFALPAIRILEDRARDLEPFKVTLQVSHKGLKIIQNVTAKGKQQTIKHFIPHGSITSAVVQADVVACVLLLYNPLTGCPVHVHAYRCSVGVRLFQYTEVKPSIFAITLASTLLTIGGARQIIILVDD